MRLTVIGNYGPYPAKGGACSGYLVEEAGTKILLECGSGVFGKLLNYCDMEEVKHIFLSHFHYDHISDIMIYKYAIESKVKRGLQIGDFNIYMPAEPSEEFNKISKDNYFNVSTVKDGMKVKINDIEVSFAKVTHTIPSFAIKLVRDNFSFVYSGDACINDFPVDFIKGADVFLCDAAFLTGMKPEGAINHLAVNEAGKISSDAGVKKLILTHFWAEIEAEQYLQDGKKYFDNIDVTMPGKVFEF